MKRFIFLRGGHQTLPLPTSTPSTPSTSRSPPRNNILATRLWIFVSFRARVKYLLMYRMGLTTYPFISRTVVMIWVSRLKARDSVTRR